MLIAFLAVNTTPIVIPATAKLMMIETAMQTPHHLHADPFFSGRGTGLSC